MLALLQSFRSATICPLECNLSAWLCTISSSMICQLWLQCVSSAQMQTLSWAATLSINHDLSAQLQTVSSAALCQLECRLSANLYTTSSSLVCQLQVEYVSLSQTQSVCSAAKASAKHCIRLSRRSRIGKDGKDALQQSEECTIPFTLSFFLSFPSASKLTM